MRTHRQIKIYRSPRCLTPLKARWPVDIFSAVIIIIVACHFALNNDTPSAKDDLDDNASYSDNSSVKETGNKAFITSISDISGGIAKATLETDKGVSYNAIIDTKGNVKYICTESEHFIYVPT